MPLGFERLNARHQSPNEKIVFIKPLEGPDKATSHDFLERIAAICAPIMRANYLSVVSLEEYEPNREFWGRNFNAGESIQLVLKSPSSGKWLPFSFVQMVMMHELAHCKQMNHSRAFWKVRNEYATELRALWAKGYTGDGLWGKGQKLYDGQYAQDTMPATDEMPQHLCGGVYRSGRGKRKRKGGSEKQVMSYAERNQRRIEKKFGTNGMALGEDENARVSLEKGKKVTAKPRVAGSVRGRELRAAAALARFEQAKEVIVNEEIVNSDSDDAYEEDDLMIKEEAVDHKGNKILDSKGQGMVKVCEGEETVDDPDARREMEELGQFRFPLVNSMRNIGRKNKSKLSGIKIKEEDISTASESEDDTPRLAKPSDSARINNSLTKYTHMVTQNKSHPATNISKETATPGHNPNGILRTQLPNQVKSVPKRPTSSNERDLPDVRETKNLAQPPGDSNSLVCPICSLANALDAWTCVACAHVLHPDKLLNHWTCKSELCGGSQYINAADVGRCGICGAVRVQS